MTPARLTGAAVALAAVGLAADGGAAQEAYPTPARPVARIVSSAWGSEKQRDQAGEVDELIRRIPLRQGAIVADIGAGEGYDALRLAAKLGKDSRILAEDLQPAPLERLREQAQARGLTNITTIVGSAADPQLPADLDAVVMAHMYHEVGDPFGLLARLATRLKRSGRVAVLELDRPTSAHGTPPALLRCEFEQSGYRRVSQSTLPGGVGYLAVFAPPAQATPPAKVRPCAPQ